ncbi:hypothetical protein J7E99_07440 [Streptomyces sp. ISL-44]|uniref:hypothetical protein n=1 Tax=Streptomyces sp. ISL-44 TaxID=2819184 RepID=UPI001BE7785F|nr:hypothetical protein [Streptomyces sp. ISL-44]MBT2540539.1 hypothetical protein [Streptomyces sp. ISL-44]
MTGYRQGGEISPDQRVVVYPPDLLAAAEPLPHGLVLDAELLVWHAKAGRWLTRIARNSPAV